MEIVETAGGRVADCRETVSWWSLLIAETAGGGGGCW